MSATTSSRLTPEAVAYRSPFAGADWLERYFNRPLKPVERVVAEMLGTVFRGIYHIQDDVDRSVWDHRFVVISYRGELATYDFGHLTELVALAHELGVRVSITARTRGYLGIAFHPRPLREGGHICDRHPKQIARVEENAS